ncbi:MAG: TonB-dependent receptor [Cyclobacteriaceae bacterium]
MKKSLFYYLLAFCLLLISENATAQLKLIFLDSETQLPVEEVIVVYGGQSTSSDSKGSVIIPAETISIQVSRTGYISMSLVLDTLLSTTFLLQPDNLFSEIEINAFPIGQLTGIVPASVSEIGKKELAIANQLDYANVLNNVPGLFMHSGTLGTSRITIRGIGARTPFGTNKIRAYYNEIPLTAGDGETSLEDNDLQMIGNITVVKGPSSTAYGAGLGGLLRLTPAKDSMNSFASTIGVGSFGLLKTYNRLVLSEGTHSFRIGYATTDMEGFRDNNQYNRENLQINYSYQGKKISLDFLSLFTDVKGQIPSSLTATDFANNPEIAASNWATVEGFEDYQKGLMGFTTTYSINSRQQLSATVYTTFRENYELRPFGILTENSLLTGTRWKYTNTFSDLVSVVVGGELSGEHFENATLEQDMGVAGELTSFNNQDRRAINFFAESLWNFGKKVELIAGLNYSKLSYDLQDRFLNNGNQSGEYGFDGVLSPRIFTGYQLTPNHLVYAQLSHGFSAPSVEETLTPDGVINPEIAPEKGLSAEIGAKGQFRNTDFSYQINLYRMTVRNLLVARRTAEDEFIGINAGKSIHQGIELEANYKQKLNGVTIEPFLALSANDIRFVDFIDEGIDYADNHLPGVPAYTATIGVFARIPLGFSVMSSYRIVGRMFLRDDNLLTTDRYSLLNVKIIYRKAFGRIDMDIDGGINNLTDEDYASQILVNAGSFGGRAPRYFYPGLPRNYFCSLSLRYKL